MMKMSLFVCSFLAFFSWRCYAVGAKDPSASWEQAKRIHHETYYSSDGSKAVQAGIRGGRGLQTNPITYIVGGVQASEGEFPWFVDWGGCGASLIHPQVLLSAAHCGGTRTNTVYVGAYQSGTTNYGAERRTMTQRVSHPLYNSNTFANDVMVAKLDVPVEVDGNNNVVTPLALNRDGTLPINGQALEVMGHGSRFSGGGSVSILRKVTVNYIPTGDCNARDSYNGRVQGNTMMCAGVDGGNKDSCQGDSGGPIVACDGNGESCTQVGIVSWGFGCGRANYPGVYARVSTFADWIQDQVCALTANQANQPDYCNTNNTSQPTSPPTPTPTAVPNATPSPTPAPTPTLAPFPPTSLRTVPALLQIIVDNWGAEVTWSLYEGQVERFSGGPYPNQVASRTFVEEWELETGKTYRFEIYDSFGDGICCSFGSGNYSAYVVNPDETKYPLFQGNGEYGSIQTHTFTVGSPASSPSFAPSMALTIPPTTASPTPQPVSPPVTTQVCADSTEMFQVDQVVGNQNCAFLRTNAEYSYLCRFVDVAAACKATCAVCFMFNLPEPIV